MRISDWSSDVCSSDLLANVYYECGATAAGDSWHAQVIALLELSAELLPGPSSYELTQALNVAADEASPDNMEIGRASCRERVGQYVSISVVAVSLSQKQETDTLLS